jgi:hypothetical protein
MFDLLHAAGFLVSAAGTGSVVHVSLPLVARTKIPRRAYALAQSVREE